MSVQPLINTLKETIEELESKLAQKESDKRFSDHRTRIVHEYDLINNRLNWMLTSQTIFFAILVILLDESENCKIDISNLELMVYILSLGSAFLIYVSILAAVVAIRKFANNADDETVIGYLSTYYTGLVAPIFLPLTFILAWLFIIWNNYCIISIAGALIFSIVVLLFIKTKMKKDLFRKKT